MSKILLPPMNAQQEAKTKHLVDMIGEYMGDDVRCESVISMMIIWPDDRIDMGAIFKKLAGNKKPLTKNSNVSKPGNGGEITGQAPALGMDELVQKAIELLKGQKVAYGNILQEQLHIGYETAKKVLNELEEKGIIGPASSGGRGREVLLSGVEVVADN